MSKAKLLFLLFVLSLVLGLRFYDFYEHLPLYFDGQQVRLTTTLQEEPDLTNRGQTFVVKTSGNQFIYVTTQAFPRIHYGEVVGISGTLKEKKLSSGRVLFSLYYPKVVVKAAAHNAVAGWAKSIREHSKQLYEGTLPSTSASLLMGIVFGAKEHFPKPFLEALRSTGVLHVIAASGMNVTFVAASLMFTLGVFMRRKWAIILACLGVIFYVFLVGFQPSIIRAAIMGLLAFGASLLGRQHFAVFAVLTSGYLMLLWQPGFLFDVGFQLSFLATLGILFIKPILEKSIGKVGAFGKVGRETITTTLAAQIATTPLLLGVFGKVGLLSLVVNALVLWTVPIMMLLGSLAVFASVFFMPLAQLILWICLPYLLFFEAIVIFFGNSGWIISIGTLPWSLSVGYYLLLVALVMVKKPEQKRLTLEESLALEKY